MNAYEEFSLSSITKYFKNILMLPSIHTDDKRMNESLACSKYFKRD
jgi:hypothetical protein